MPDLYSLALQDARRRSFKIRDTSYNRILRAFAHALSQLAEVDDSSPMKAARAQAMKEQVQGMLARLRELSKVSVEGSVRNTVVDLVQIHREVNEEIIKRAGRANAISVASTFDRVPSRVYAVLAARDQNAATFKSLLNRSFNASIRDVDALIDSAVIRGVSAGNLSRDMATLIGDPSLIPHLPSGSRLHRGQLNDLDWARYGVTPDQVKPLKALLYDARRIAVTEPMNAMREANAVSMVQSPLVSAAKWQLSGRHPKKDECDVLARSQYFKDLPPGYFPPEKWPQAPHPHCACIPGGPTLLRPATEWGKPKGLAPSPLPSPVVPKDLQEAVSEKRRARAVPGDYINRTLLGPVHKATPIGGGWKVKEKPKPRLTKAKTEADIDSDIIAILDKPRTGVPTAESFVEQIGVAMDAKAFGLNVRTQARSPGKFLFDDPYFQTSSADAVAHWDGTIGFNKRIGDNLARFRAEWYIAKNRGLDQTMTEAFQTVIHELEHMKSPTRLTGLAEDALSYGSTQGSRYIEEGIVERKARQRTVRLLHKKEHYSEMPFRWRAYHNYTEGVNWYANTFGEDALEEVWNITNGRLRVGAMADKVRGFLENRAQQIGHPVLRSKVFSEIATLKDEDLVNQMHEFAALWPSGPIGDTPFRNVIKLLLTKKGRFS